MTEPAEAAEPTQPTQPTEAAEAARPTEPTEAAEAVRPTEPTEPTEGTEPSPALRYDQRPYDDTPRHTEDLPPTPVRDRNIPATAWVEAPDELRRLGEDLPDQPVAEYKRRIGPWLLWRAGPASGGDARYWAARVDDLAAAYTFRLYPDGTGEGTGPRDRPHTRFRTWKEDLRDSEA